jgi:hypothetical protein
VEDQTTYLTEKELALRWRCTPGALRTARYEGRNVVPFVKIGSRTRYRLTDVLAAERLHGR